MVPQGIAHIAQRCYSLREADDETLPGFEVAAGKDGNRPTRLDRLNLEAVFCGPPFLDASPPRRFRCRHLLLHLYQLLGKVLPNGARFMKIRARFLIERVREKQVTYASVPALRCSGASFIGRKTRKHRNRG